MSSSTVLPARLGPPDTAAVPALAGAAADVFAALLFEHAVSAVPVASVNATSRAAGRQDSVALCHPGELTGLPAAAGCRRVISALCRGAVDGPGPRPGCSPPRAGARRGRSPGCVPGPGDWARVPPGVGEISGGTTRDHRSAR